MSKTQQQVDQFIQTIRGAAPCMMRQIFTHGGCYRFYKILKERFPKAEAWWTRGFHVVSKIDGRWWDICGPVEQDTVLRKLNRKDHLSGQVWQFDEVHYMCKLAQLKVVELELT